MSQIAILDCFDRAPDDDPASQGPTVDGSLSAAEIVARTGLPRSTVFRDLRILVNGAFVYQHPVSKRYALGPRMLQLGMTARRQLGSEDLVAVPLLELGRVTSETVTFSLLELPWRICVYSIDAPSELRQIAQAGARYPLHLGAAGKAILAQLAPDVAAAVLTSHEVSRQRATAINADLERIRVVGTAVSTGERVAGTSSAAAAVFVRKVVCGSVAVAGPTDRVLPRVEVIREHVAVTAQRLTDLLSQAPELGGDTPRPRRQRPSEEPAR